MTYSDNERLQLANEVTALYPRPIPARRFLDALEDPLNPANTQIVEQEILVPDSGKVELWYDPKDNPYLTTCLDIWTGTGKTGTQFTKLIGSTAVNGYNVRIYPEHPSWLDFSTDRAGETVYATIDTAYSAITGTALTRLYSEVRALGLAMTGFSPTQQVIAAEDIPADSFVRYYHDGSALKVYLADNTSIDNIAHAYASEEILTDESGYVSRIGAITTLGTRRTSPANNTRIYLSPEPGGYTWEGDTDATYKFADAPQILQLLGDTYNGTHGDINLISSFVAKDWTP